MISPRVAITTIYFLNGAVFSEWYGRLPAIQADVGLGPAGLGVALLGAPAGLLVAQPLVGGVVARRGSRPIVAAAPFYVPAVCLPAVAVDTATLLVAAVAVGAANGTLDIAMNTQGIAVERARRRRIFNSLHAAFSFGALGGAGVAAAVAAIGVDPLPHLIGAGVAGSLLAAMVAPALMDDRAAADRTARRLVRPTRSLAALGFIAFCALLAEGAVFDWSGIYLAREAGAGDGVAPLGLAVFALAMGVGRLAGDAVSDRFGAPAVARAGAALAAAGLALGLATATAVGGLAGFALMGAGLAAVFPLTLRASGFIDPPGPALAAVSTIGYGGFLLGPPLIGMIAAGIGLRAALALVCALCLLAATMARHVRDARQPEDARHVVA
ncbi:MAG TPA: MFS transporter [Thermoleophilaceae bacterium]|nr:MFS transporter [Thermoleophilaceae bacterium]